MYPQAVQHFSDQLLTQSNGVGRAFIFLNDQRMARSPTFSYFLLQPTAIEILAPQRNNQYTTYVAMSRQIFTSR